MTPILPKTISQPNGTYVHGLAVPAGARLLFVSGQIPVHRDGSIPKDFKDKVFDKFFRVPTQAISEVKGFGIGLYYVKEVCKAHKWKINIKSRFPLDGTEINLLIPLKSNI